MPMDIRPCYVVTFKQYVGRGYHTNIFIIQTILQTAPTLTNIIILSLLVARGVRD